MPGVLIIEALAQAAGILGFMTMGKTPEEGSIYYFAGADKVRFKNPVSPGDTINLYASIRSEKRGIWKFDCRAEVDGKNVCEATILCADPVSNTHLRDHETKAYLVYRFLIERNKSKSRIATFASK